jgi:arsenite methyltransferase
MDPWGGPTPDLSDASVVALFDELPLWSAPFGLALLEAVELRAGLTVLDVGCATGFPLLELAERLGPGARLHGVDPWLPAVERLRTKLAAWALDTVTLHPCRVEALSLPPASMDLVVSNNGLNNVPDLDLAMAICARLTRPGGQLVFTANLPATMQAFYDAFGAAMDGARRPELREALRHHVEGKRKTTAALVGAADRAGFEIVGATEHRFEWPFASADALFRHHFVRLGFLEPWRAVVPLEVRGEVFRRLAAGLDDVVEREGMLRLDVPFVCISARRRVG